MRSVVPFRGHESGANVLLCRGKNRCEKSFFYFKFYYGSTKFAPFSLSKERKNFMKKKKSF